jgi:hypothetical protein
MQQGNQGRGKEGSYYPSPPTPLPFQGRGVPARFLLCVKNTESAPRVRREGDGSGQGGEDLQSGADEQLAQLCCGGAVGLLQSGGGAGVLFQFVEGNLESFFAALIHQESDQQVADI